MVGAFHLYILPQEYIPLFQTYHFLHLFSNQTTFLSADLSSGYNDSMIEVITGIAPISFKCLFIPKVW